MDSNLPLVVVVLSTFNGERYLREQLESLFCQTYKNIEIIVRDDGSGDSTVEILQDVARGHDELSVVPGRNIGVIGSFLELLDMVPANAGFVALCDQDDVWQEDKIERAVSMIADLDASSPAMYCGAVDIVDERLNHIRVERQARREVSLENALVQNVATGCTTLLNQAALQLVTSKSVVADRIGMHDWWLYQVVSTFGRVVFDSTPKILYRQHGQNVVGYASGIHIWINRIKRQLGPKSKIIRKQANELLRLYGDEMPAENQLLIREFLERTQSSSITERVAYALKSPVFRQSSFDDLVLRSMMVFAQI